MSSRLLQRKESIYKPKHIHLFPLETIKTYHQNLIWIQLLFTYAIASVCARSANSAIFWLASCCNRIWKSSFACINVRFQWQSNGDQWCNIYSASLVRSTIFFYPNEKTLNLAVQKDLLSWFICYSPFPQRISAPFSAAYLYVLYWRKTWLL